MLKHVFTFFLEKNRMYELQVFLREKLLVGPRRWSQASSGCTAKPSVRPRMLVRVFVCRFCLAVCVLGRVGLGWVGLGWASFGDGGGANSSDVVSVCLVCLFVVVWLFVFGVGQGRVGLGWVSFVRAPTTMAPRFAVAPIASVK